MFSSYSNERLRKIYCDGEAHINRLADFLTNKTPKLSETLIKKVCRRKSREFVAYLEGNTRQNRNVNIFN